MLKNKTIIIFIIITAIFLIYWLSRSVIIVDVHKDRHWSDIVVKNFPITKWGKIAWWKKNQTFLKDKYDIPVPDNEGVFSIVIWGYGEGYEIYPYSERGNDMICFDDMPTEVNCLEKDRLLEIHRYPNSDEIEYY